MRNPNSTKRIPDSYGGISPIRLFLDEPLALPSQEVSTSIDAESKIEDGLEVPIIFSINMGFKPQFYVFSDFFWDDHITISKTASVKQWIDKIVQNVYKNCRHTETVSHEELKISIRLTKGWGGGIPDYVMVASVVMWKAPLSPTREERALLGKQKFTNDPGRWLKEKYSGVKNFLGK
ncbi:hypothetical protein AA313_de0204474 [Arthrobotrys entomopaga]|nr:hypothetical protein AA313_de0204474 [Arthrobotrys entomopaga]